MSRARRLIGVRFRAQGRSAEGLDCVGLAAAAVGLPLDGLPGDYRLRGDHSSRIIRELARAGLLRAADEPRAGDILLVQAGPEQWHLLVLTDGGFVHADASAGHVVERPAPIPWPVACAWRQKENA